MTEAPVREVQHEVDCPHCRKSFRATLIGDGTARRGFKCPHCRLFVPLARVEDQQPESA
jgi:transposase-like protein